MFTVNPDPGVVERLLTRRSLICPRCQVGMVRPFGWTRRHVRLASPSADASGAGEVARPGREQRIRLRRALCTAKGCGATHVLLPHSLLARRLDEVVVIGQALALRVRGWSWRRIAARFGRPVSTVRGWWRRMAANAERLRVAFTVGLHALELDTPAALEPTGSPVGDVVAVVAEVAAAVRRFTAGVARAAVWQVASALTGGALLGPDPPVRILQHLRT
jgi:hypothetical protein